MKISIKSVLEITNHYFKIEASLPSTIFVDFLISSVDMPGVSFS